MILGAALDGGDGRIVERRKATTAYQPDVVRSGEGWHAER
jgi:hypothetical protein